MRASFPSNKKGLLLRSNLLSWIITVMSPIEVFIMGWVTWDPSLGGKISPSGGWLLWIGQGTCLWQRADPAWDNPNGLLPPAPEHSWIHRAWGGEAVRNTSNVVQKILLTHCRGKSYKPGIIRAGCQCSLPSRQAFLSPFLWWPLYHRAP